MFGLEVGFIGLLLLIANIWAIVSTFQSNTTTAKKVLWIAFILVFPFLGFVVWLLIGPRSAS